jgi:uncharacterized protein YjeT (DUF2065 family)
MNRFLWIVIAVTGLVVVVVALGVGSATMPGAWKKPALAKGYSGMVPAEAMLRVPVSGI